MQEKEFNPYDGPKPILSLFQWSFGGYLGPSLIIYEDGCIVKAVYDDPNVHFSRPKIKATVISSDELKFLTDKIAELIDKRETKSKIIYDLSQGITDQPTVDIMCNVSSVRHIRIEGCYIKNEKISYNESRDEEYGIKFPKQDKVPASLKKCLKFLCEYKFLDFKEYIPYYFDFSLEERKGDGETVNWPEDFPELESLPVKDYSSSFSFFIEGKYYKRVLEYYLNNQHKNIRYKNSERELYHYPQLIFPHQELFHYPWR